jgi:DNA-binding transcriptional MocR family regulator
LLYRQVYRELVQLIRSGRLRPAARLPSSRVLAQELGIGRNTVLLALEHLMSEGAVETGAAMVPVAAELPDRTPFRFAAQADVRARPLELPGEPDRWSRLPIGR